MRSAPEYGGFRSGITVDEIIEINEKLGQHLRPGQHPSSALAAAARETGFFKKCAAIIRAINKNHMFTDANKRTSVNVYEILRKRNNITDGVSEDTAGRVVDDVASGKLDQVDDIAEALKGH